MLGDPLTLVAAIKICDTPVLFGDLMLTERDRTSTRRKILRLRPTLAVGWSGTHIVARAIFRDLNDKLPFQPTIEEVRNALRQFSDENGFLSVQLTGWVLGHESVAFMWDGHFPNEFVLGEQFAIGSGLEVLMPRLTDRRLHAPPPPEVSTAEHVRSQALTLTGNLMKSDLSDRIQQSRFGFGVGYDVLVGESGRFRYISPVIYAAMSAQVDGEGHIRDVSRPLGVALLRTVGEHTFCQAGLNIDQVMDIDLISPVFSTTSKASKARLQRALLRGPYVFEGKYCVLFTQLIEGSKPWPPLVGVIPRSCPIWLRSDKRGVHIAGLGFIQAAAIEMARQRRGRW